MVFLSQKMVNFGLESDQHDLQGFIRAMHSDLFLCGVGKLMCYPTAGLEDTKWVFFHVPNQLQSAHNQPVCHPEQQL